MRILYTWLGNTDIRASQDEPESGNGPIANAFSQLLFDQVVVLSDHEPEVNDRYVSWLSPTEPIEVRRAALSSPTDYSDIYLTAKKAIEETEQSKSGMIERTFHLSPGTPAMAAVWIILSQMAFPAQLIESSIEAGVRSVTFPFDLSAEYLAKSLKRADYQLEELSQALTGAGAEFEGIIHKCDLMKDLIARARLISKRDVPVLLLGESGTGKELLAQAIHKASKRDQGPIVAINCGAIPKDLIESELFGHEKGAFTGAVSRKVGVFEAASGGTLFLDEIGDLPEHAQVKLLRALQDHRISRVGSTEQVAVDVRIIAATHHDIVTQIRDSRFREDLFYRLAVGVLKIPPVRDRAGDVGLLVDHTIEALSRELSLQTNQEHKRLSPKARQLLINHPWPGNVREMRNVLTRAIVWSIGKTISDEDISSALLPVVKAKTSSDLLDRKIGNGFDLQELLDGVAKHYLTRAVKESHGVKRRAAALLGFENYQTLSYWMKKHDITG